MKCVGGEGGVRVKCVGGEGVGETDLRCSYSKFD